ncbi:GNAT family N-acetyltransferase [Paenibacillus albidus]|nr:GNAT family N-acetyltransferase [Paenibacillus albidus]
MPSEIIIESELLILKRTDEEDIDFVLNQESSTENNRFITQWTKYQHFAAIGDPDKEHIIIQSKMNERIVGFIILAGLENYNNSIELLRIVISDKGHGFGHECVRLIKEICFKKYMAHRLWLDVKEHNHRAKHVYLKCGFTIEGTIRECIRTDNKYESLIIMSILETEYQDLE